MRDEEYLARVRERDEARASRDRARKVARELRALLDLPEGYTVKLREIDDDHPWLKWPARRPE